MATTITTWTSLLKPFLPIFTQPVRVIFTRLTVGWILCTVRRTVTGMLPFADPFGVEPRRFSFDHRRDDDSRRSDWLLRRPLGDRGYVQEYQTVPGWPAASDVQRQRSRTSSRLEPLVVFDGLALVSFAKEQQTLFRRLAVVPLQVHTQLRRRVDCPSPRSLARKNKMYVRCVCRS